MGVLKLMGKNFKLHMFIQLNCKGKTKILQPSAVRLNMFLQIYLAKMVAFFLDQILSKNVFKTEHGHWTSLELFLIKLSDLLFIFVSDFIPKMKQIKLATKKVCFNWKMQYLLLGFFFFFTGFWRDYRIPGHAWCHHYRADLQRWSRETGLHFLNYSCLSGKAKMGLPI